MANCPVVLALLCASALLARSTFIEPEQITWDTKVGSNFKITKEETHKLPIWIYWQYNGRQMSPFVELNLRTCRKHNPNREIRAINESNVKELIPDMPDEFFKMTDIPARSDIVRAGIMVHHGGLYMDTDFLCMSSFDPILEKLVDHDIVSYGNFNDAGKPDIPDGACFGPHFSSNWHAGRPGNVFSTTWWENMKLQLTRVCPKGGMSYTSKMVCCHEEGRDDASIKSCHMTFGYLEHLKFYKDFKRGKTMEEIGPYIHLDQSQYKMYCLNGDRNLIPHINGEIYWMPWKPLQNKTANGPWAMPHYKINCTLTPEGDMDCGEVHTRRAVLRPKKFRNFFGRIAYHLFFTTYHKNALKEVKTPKDVLRKNWLLSEMYRRSLGMKVRRKKDMHKDALETDIEDPEDF
eukprot:m.17874 g.17874  ORF g.17874 m.17874 type:complete len:405 (+) comp6135_c0_seq1:112-1326(+)